MPVMDHALREGYETSRRMQRRHDPTYYFATRRLPAELRPATHALYGYVRTADQIVDGPRRPATPDGRRAALDAWEAELEAGDASREPIVRALTDAAARHRLPLGELRTYMRSMRIDCAPVRISSWEELVAYMDGSAGSVGRIMAALLGVPARHHSDLGRLGLAFQLANFIRDVREDRRLDRVYLPTEDRERFGVSEDDLAAEHASAEVRALVAQWDLDLTEPYQVRLRRSLGDKAADAAVAEAPNETMATLGEILLTPTRIYARAVLAARSAVRAGGHDVHAIAHITGGGLPGNVPRGLPDGLAARLDPARWRMPSVMRLFGALGGLDDKELRATFNGGLGMTLVVPRAAAERAIGVLAEQRIEAAVVGEVVSTEEAGGARYVEGQVGTLA